MVALFMLADTESYIEIAIFVVMGTLTPVSSFVLAPEINHVLLATQDTHVFTYDDYLEETERAEEDPIIARSIDKSSSSDSENLDIGENSVDQQLESRDVTSSESKLERSNIDRENENSDNDKQIFLSKGIPNIERILPPDRLTSGEIVSVPNESGSNNLIVRGDPLDPTAYLVCASNRMNYECTSHSYPVQNK